MGDIVEALFSVAPHLRDGSRSASNHVMIRCPFHRMGQERTPSMSVSTVKPCFFCHGCGESGHVSRLLRRFGLGRDAIDIIVRDTGMSDASAVRAHGGTVAAKYIANLDPFRGEYILDEEILDTYRMAPMALLESGFEKATLRHFEVGFDKPNLRITFPLRNIYGELVGISGRAVLGGMEPKYRIYVNELIRRKDFSVPQSYTMETVKESLLWHAHIVRPFLLNTDEPLVITEGFKACMWVWQTAYQNAVALIGAYLTKPHAELITTSVRRVILFLDNNDAGLRGTYNAGDRLTSVGVEVYVARYPDSREQPDDLNEPETQKAIENADQYLVWRENNGKRFIHEATIRAASRELQ